MPPWGKVLDDEQIHARARLRVDRVRERTGGRSRTLKMPETNPVADRPKSLARGEANVPDALHRLPWPQGGWKRT